MKILIIDNEKHILDFLHLHLQKFGIEPHFIFQADGVQQGLKIFDEVKPDVVFLDVEMEDGTGFDFLNRLNKLDFQLIFITAYEKYAVQAFKYCAIDFLLKPIDTDELAVALERATKNLAQIDHQVQLDMLKSMVSSHTTKPSKIILKNSDAIFYIKIEAIILCEADGPYTIFEVENHDKIIVSTNIKVYEELLTPHNFVRVHNSFLVNTNKVIRFDKQDGGFLMLENNKSVPVSQRKKDEILKKLHELL